MNALLILLLLSVGLLNLAPITGIVSSEILQNAYGVTLTDPNLVILMRHRAALFGIIGGLIVACAFLPSLRLVAIITGLVSMISFVLIAQSVDGINAQLRRIVVADGVGIAILIGAAALHMTLESR